MTQKSDSLTSVPIQDLFERDIHREIPAVVVVSNRAALANEVAEYVVTDAIRDAFHGLIRTFLGMQDEPSQRIGVWVSGFFGSGKSSFAKMFGYTLANPEMPDGRPLRNHLLERFGGSAETLQLFGELDQIKRPIHAIIFDLSQDAASGENAISPIAYKQLLRHFRYSSNPLIAELELQLERDSRMDAFRKEYRHQRGVEWTGGGMLAINQASAVMHALEPEVFNAPDSWARAQPANTLKVTPKLLADRALEIAERRGEGAIIVFVVDEVGQYASRDIDRMLDLQGILHAFDSGGSDELPEGSGVLPGSGRGRLWFVATAQEQLSAVVENLDSKQSELARLMDRFQQPIDLKPQDIAEVTTQRLLKKKPAAEDQLRALFRASSHNLKLYTELDANTRPELHENDFVNLYPLLPYQFGLIIEIIGAIRQHGQVVPTFGAAVRPVLSMSQMILRDERLGIAHQKVGTLVRMDQIYDSLERDKKIPDEQRNTIGELKAKTDLHGALGEDALRVAKALVLLGFTRTSTYRTLKTITALVYPDVNAPSQEERVRAALDLLAAERFVREDQGNYEFLSREGRTWEEERAQIDPGSKVREKQREAMASVLSAMTPYSHEQLRSFRLTLLVDGNRPAGGAQGDMDLRLSTSLSPEAAFSDSQVHRQSVIGSVALGRDAEEAARNLLRSQAMLGKYAQNSNYAKQVGEEERRLRAQTDRLTRAVQAALLSGRYYFDGHEIPLPEQLAVTRLGEQLLRFAVPRVYRLIDRVQINPRTADFAALLTLPKLTASQKLLGVAGLNILQAEGGEQVIKAQAPVLQDIVNFIGRRQGDGYTVTGKDIEAEFEGAPFGWTSDRVRYLTATLLRAGQLRVQAGGRTLTSWSDDGTLETFERVQNFRSAQFALREDALTSTQLMEASQRVSDLTGKSIYILDEGELGRNIREHLKPLAERASRVVERLTSHRLPQAGDLTAARDALRTITTQDTSVEVIRAYLDSSQTLRDTAATLDALDRHLSGETLTQLRNARTALERYAPELPEQQETAQALQAALDSPTFYSRHPDILARTHALEQAWAAHYAGPWSERHAAYTAAVARLRATPGFEALEQSDPEVADRLVAELTRYRGDSEVPAEDHWRRVDPALEHLASDVLAASKRLQQVQQKLEKIVNPDHPPQRIPRQALHLDPGDLTAAEAQLESYLSALRQQVLDALQQGRKVVVE